MATSTISKSVAELTAAKNGVSLDQVLSLNKTSVLATLKDNPHPSASPIAGMIKLFTYQGGNVNNNTIIAEQYTIKPNFTGLIICPGQKKGIWYLPIPNSIYAIKFYGPDEYNANYYNMVYCVPAKKDVAYVTGFKDYTTAVPAEFKTAFVQYASLLPNNVKDRTLTAAPTISGAKTFDSTKATQNIQFSFNFWGNLSGTLGNASTFAFEWSFYPGQTPLQPAVIGTVGVTVTSN